MSEKSEKSTEKTQSSGNNTLFSILGLGGTAVALFVYIIYLMGRIYYNNYLAYFGVNGNAFPLDQNAYQIYGIIVSLNNHEALIGPTFIAAIVFLVVICLFFWSVRGIKKLIKFSLKPMETEGNITRLLENAILFMTTCFLFIIALACVINTAGSTAQSRGRNKAESDEKYFNQGISDKYEGHPFVYLREDGGVDEKEKKQTSMYGFLIDHSETRVVLYCKSKTTEYELKGRYLDTDISIRDIKDTFGKDNKYILPGNRADLCQYEAVFATLPIESSQPSFQQCLGPDAAAFITSAVNNAITTKFTLSSINICPGVQPSLQQCIGPDAAVFITSAVNNAIATKFTLSSINICPSEQNRLILSPVSPL
jgi:hypothetical protein